MTCELVEQALERILDAVTNIIDHHLLVAIGKL